MTAHRSPDAPYYYISHALPVPSDPWLRSFHHDVQAEMHRRLGPGPGHAGLLAEPCRDPVGAEGPDWTPAMRCRTLLVLLTERYYKEPRTLRDLEVFRRRLLWGQHQTGERSTALVLVPWNTQGLPSRREPDTLAVPVGDYTRSGLGGLVRAPHARGGYLKVLRAVVERILTGARHSPPVMTPEDLYFTVSSGVSGMPRIPLSARKFLDRQFAPVRVPWAPTHAAPPSRPAEAWWEAAPHRSWFSTPESDERPILRGPHS
ncbi:hypothetical protein ABZV77_13060 [Streptomyces sp. NPDC004732]|uniref:hypothetical protein n=1 Tax=Streptomyces sp. NPDC004732 TaxID=3154290 RepID=UPI0033B329BA